MPLFYNILDHLTLEPGSEAIMNLILGHRQELIYTDESAEYETDREACYEKDRRRRRQIRK